MNTKQEWKTTARVTDPERKAFWESIFGSDRIPIISFVGKSANLPGFDGPQYVYELDLRVITDDQRERLIDAIVQKFDVAADYVAAVLNDEGVPILASDVSVSSTDRALVMGAVL